MTNVIVTLIVLLIVGSAAAYIVKAKRRGVKCIGCPAGAACGGTCKASACGTASCSCDLEVN